MTRTRSSNLFTRLMLRICSPGLAEPLRDDKVLTVAYFGLVPTEIVDATLGRVHGHALEAERPNLGTDLAAPPQTSWPTSRAIWAPVTNLLHEVCRVANNYLVLVLYV